MAVSRSVWIAASIALAVAALPAACSRDVVIGENRSTLLDAQMGGAPATGGASQTDAKRPVCIQSRCQNHVYACGDCTDNDDDGLVDMEDPDCLGPCQDSESSFFGNIPGQNNAGCVQDCYFDQDSGAGNDDCEWSHACDRASVPPDYPPQGPECAYDPNTKVNGPRGQRDCAALEQSQSAQCLSYCGPLTPNGCDCFGCCRVPGAPTPIWMGSLDSAGNTCDWAHVDDPSRCRPCTQVPGCLNTCDTCELCVGKRSLPPSCAEGGCSVPVCPAGLTPCGTPCSPGCAEGEICITGCCVREPH